MITENNPNNQENNQEIYAGLWVRLAAAMIDMVITAPIVWALLHIVGVDMSKLVTVDQMFSGIQPEPDRNQNIADFISYVVSIAYSIYFITSRKQATPGKRMMNIYIATRDGEKLSVNRAFARFFASMLSLLLFGVGVLMIAFHQEKAALHDIICGTRVFYGKKS